jgi:hypothetical protein
MSKLDTWFSEIGRSVVALGSEPSIGVSEPPSPALSRTVALTGFPGVLPLWSGRRHTVGLLVKPLSVPRTWPGVILQDGEGLTIASDARTLLPQLIVMRLLSKFPDAGRKLAERWREIGPNALALHRVLGGTEEELEEVVAIARDPARREVFNFRKGQEAAFEEAHSTLCRKIDRSEPFVRYADWLDAWIAGCWIAPQDQAYYGAWGRRVHCWARILASLSPAAPKLASGWLHRIVESDAGIDSGLPARASWSVQAGSASGETALVEAAMEIDPEPPPTDPVSAGIVRALLTEGTSYRGLAHAEAVVALDERGEPERAWGALQSAAWWAARNTGQVPEAMFEGARFLAERHDWVDVRWVIERAATIAGNESPP